MKQLSVHRTLFVGLLIISIPCNGQVSTQAEAYRDSLYRHIWLEGSAKKACRFTYRQGIATIDINLGNNPEELSLLANFIHVATQHPTLFIERIRLTGYSSIEGSYAYNESLARDRVEQFYLYLRGHYPELYRYSHDLAWVAEDWKGLSALVKQSNLNEREEILEIIRKVPGFDEREALLMKLNGGHAYRIMECTMFPKLRRVEMEIEYAATAPEPTVEEPVSQPTDQTASPQPSPKEREQEPSGIETSERHVAASLSFGGSEALHPSSPAEPLFALKTNLLLWSGIQCDFKHTAPVANVALEYFINPCFSIELGAMYSYWRYNSNHEFQGVSGYRLEPRFRKSLPGDRFGAHLGVYFRFGDYDLRNEKNSQVDSSQLTVDSYHADNAAQPTVNYQLSTVNSSPRGRTGEYWDAGLSTGITVNLVGGLGLEVGARFGYVKTNTINYTRENGDNWFDEYKPYNKFRVTDLNLNLVYRFR